MSLIAGAIPLADVMQALSRDGPVFHGEEDVQFAFAQTAQRFVPNLQCRLKKPMSNTATGKTELGLFS